jgi:hypothetical protein
MPTNSHHDETFPISIGVVYRMTLFPTISVSSSSSRCKMLCKVDRTNSKAFLDINKYYEVQYIHVKFTNKSCICTTSPRNA